MFFQIYHHCYPILQLKAGKIAEKVAEFLGVSPQISVSAEELENLELSILEALGKQLTEDK